MRYQVGQRYTARDAKTGEHVQGILLDIDAEGYLYINAAWPETEVDVRKCVPEEDAPKQERGGAE